MSRYYMRPKTYNRFKTMGYNLVCKICDEDIKPFDEVESKASGKGPKLYHAECYDGSHYESDDENEILKYEEDELKDDLDEQEG